MNHVVILAGGIGSRFWPLSTPEYPKQFIDILGVGCTLIQLTYNRFVGVVPDQNVWVVTNEKYVDIVREQLPNIPAENILAEPTARNTAPCIAWACWCIRQKDADANVVVTPSDAIVMNTVEFKRIIENSLAFTRSSDSIVTVGIKPNRPETGYGYVQAMDDAIGEIHKVAAFKEKPKLEIAQEYFSAGDYLWNAGIFVFHINTMVSALIKEKPNIASNMDKIVATGDVATIFSACEKVSIDYAVMEPAANEGYVYTYPADFGWSDLGNWHSLSERIHKDANNNAIVGNVKFFESSNNIVHMENAKRVVLQGLNGYIISEKDGQFLICKRSEEQRIKEYSAD